MIPVSVSQSVTWLNSASQCKVAEWIIILFGINPPGGSWNIDGGPASPNRGGLERNFDFCDPLYLRNG